jgi:hypothetical protein
MNAITRKPRRGNEEGVPMRVHEVGGVSDAELD